MATLQTKWLGWLAALLVLAAIGTGLWYVHAHGYFKSAVAWMPHLFAKQGAGKSDPGKMDKMDMNMPGMDMSSTGRAPFPTTSGVPGHAEVTIPGEVQQRIGVTVGKVEEGPLRMSVRTVGIVQPDESKMSRVHLRTEGWVRELFVSYTGQQVKKGDKLLSIYSPQFVTTQVEFLNARQAATGTGEKSLAQLARQRLELWDVPPEEITELERTGRPKTYLTLRSRISGTVLAKNVYLDQYVTPQTELYELANLSTVWVQAKVYEYELPHIEEGQPATVTTAALPGREFTGKVVFVQPTVQEPTRTTEVRVELSNRDGQLKPGMFTQVIIQHTMGNGLLVPSTAVIRTGERVIAYRVAAPGKFLPVEIQISPFRFENPHGQGGRFQVLQGLHAGEEVVTSADFLIDSESRLRVGMGGMMPGMPGMEMGGMKEKDRSGMGNMKGMKR